MAKTLSKIDASAYLLNGEVIIQASSDLDDTTTLIGLFDSLGTSGQVLTSNGESTDPTFQDLPADQVGWQLLDTQTASASASLNFTTGIDSTYTAYQFHILNLAPSSDDQILVMRTSSNGGSSYDSTSGNYEFAVSSWSSGGSNNINSSSTTGTSINLTGATATWGWGNASNETGSGTVTVYDPSATKYTMVESKLSYTGAAGTIIHSTGGGVRESTSAVNAVQFLFGSGNIASGTIKLYGLA